VFEQITCFSYFSFQLDKYFFINIRR